MFAPSISLSIFQVNLLPALCQIIAGKSANSVDIDKTAPEEQSDLDLQCLLGHIKYLV